MLRKLSVIIMFACFIPMNLTMTKLMATETSTGFAVVELFTSEGCSSCPSADAVLADLQNQAGKNQEIYCLGYHVDYWDRLGWKDTYSSKEATQRQNAYSQLFKSDSIYTPQMIVNGEIEFVGSNKKLAEKHVTEALSQSPTATLTVNQKLGPSNELLISGKISTNMPEHTIYACLVQATGTNQIMRGENSGRKLSHVSIVRDINHTTAENNEFAGIKLKLPSDIPTASLSVITFLQHNTTGKIVAASKVTVK